MTHCVAIFDYDGVIADSSEVKTRVFEKFFRRYPRIYAEMVRFHRVNKGTSRYFQLRYMAGLLGGGQDVASSLIAEMSQLMISEVSCVKLIPGMRRILERFAATNRLFIVSNSPVDELHHSLQNLEIETLFAGIYGSHETSTKKTNLQLCLAECSLERHQCVYIGDTQKDHEAAASLGLRFIGFKNSLSAFSTDVQFVSSAIELEHELEEHFYACHSSR